MDHQLNFILNLLMLSGWQTLTILNHTNATTLTGETSSVLTLADPTATTETSFNGNPTYVGCFKETVGYRYNKDYYHFTMPSGACVPWCVKLGMEIATVRYRSCSCGFTLTLNTTRVDDTECSGPCKDILGYTCSGALYNITHLLPPAQNSGVDNLEMDVRFLIGTSGKVQLYNSSDLNNPQLLFENDYLSFPTADYHYSKNLLFLAARNTLYKTSLFPNNVSELHFTKVFEMEGCKTFAVDWVKDRIVWVGCSSIYTSPYCDAPYTLKFTDLEDQNTSTISAGLKMSYIRRIAIDPYNGMLFWIQSDYVIKSCETNGANMRTNVSKPGVMTRELTLDISNKRLFYFGSLETKSIIFSVDYDGDELRTHLAIPRRETIYELGISRGFVYWIDVDYEPMLFKSPLYHDPAAQLNVLMLLPTRFISFLKILDPDAQKAPETGLSSSNNSCLDGDVTERKNLLLLGLVAALVAVLVMVFVVAGVGSFIYLWRKMDLVLGTSKEETTVRTVSYTTMGSAESDGTITDKVDINIK